jgi:hypothetical protein
MKIVKTKINWINKNNEQIKKLLSSKKYSTVAKFEDIKNDWPKFAWSIILDSLEIIEEPNITIGNLKFLSPEGPSQLLYNGSKFELYEGITIVAQGEIIT